MRLTDLLKGTSVLALRDDQNQHIEIRGLSSDSRVVGDGYIFAAVEGQTHKGTNYIDQAIENGATAILVPKDYRVTFKKTSCPVVIESENPRRDLAIIASNFYQEKPEILSAVTGTNGKTSVAWFTKQFYEMQSKKAACLGTLGLVSGTELIAGSMTTPDPISLHDLIELTAKKGTEALCLEASSHGLDQERLAGLTFGAAAFTNLTRDHLDYHLNEKNYFEAKSKLFSERLIQGGKAIIYKQCKFADALIAICQKRQIQIMTYGANQADIELLKQVPTSAGQKITVKIAGTVYQGDLRLIGDFQALNVLCAMALSGIEPQKAFEHLSDLQPVPGRMEMVAKTDKGGMVYVDYAHTTDALERVLKTTRHHTRNKLHVVFGCGGNRDKGKRPEMGRVAARWADYIYITDDNPRAENPAEIRQDILKECPKAQEIADRKMAIQQALFSLEEGDVLIVAGKGHERGQILDQDTIPFHDPSVIREILSCKEQSTIISQGG